MPVAPELASRRFETLARYAQRLVEESSGGVFGDALDAIIDAGPALGGMAFAVETRLQQVAERRLANRPGLTMSRLPSVLEALAARAVQNRSAVVESQLTLADASQAELAAVGAKSALAVPLIHRRRATGALVLLFGSDAAADTTLVGFVSTIANLLALVLEREQQSGNERARRAELEETQRMASLGLVTASLSHELRTPVAALSVQLVEQRRLLEQLEAMFRLSDTPFGDTTYELAELTREIEAAAAQLQQTLDQLAALSRRDGKSEPVDLRAIVQDALVLARPSFLRRSIHLSEELELGCVAQGRREDLAQVVLNLLLNAAEACERGGKRAEIGLRVRSSDNRILLEVEDNGPGVPEDTLRLIFRPFYTTKQHGFATGLGLKVCSDVVAAHGGHIEVQNRQSGGAIFRVVLQRLDDESGVHVVARSPADWMPQDQSIRRILIVDDDPVFTRTVQRAVRPHLVRTAATASEAEIALLDTKYAPDLVLCHVLLPGINGNELHRRVCAHRPELRLRFVFCTAGALSAAEADYIKKSGCCTLVKPIDPRRVLNLLEAACYDSLAPNSIRTLRPSEIPEYRSSAPPSK